MKKVFQTVFFLTPRVISCFLLLILFLFAFDAFNQSGTLIDNLVDFLFQLIPFALGLIIFIIATTREWVGLGFVFIGLLYQYFTFTDRPITSFSDRIPLSIAFYVLAIFWMIHYLYQHLHKQGDLHGR